MFTHIRCAKGRLSWVIAGQQSAPVGLEWFPPSSENRLKYIDLGENDDRPCIFFKRLGWTKRFGIYRMEMINENKGEEGCRRDVKGRLSWVIVQK